jgi:tRNA (adenine57-N1/adenine58-N1)-methyltransferase
MLSFLPTILQVHQLVMELERDSRFQLVETVETLLRPWHVTGRSVRPAHRMVAHSGFLTTAVRCEPRATALKPSLDVEDNRETDTEATEEEANGRDG